MSLRRSLLDSRRRRGTPDARGLLVVESMAGAQYPFSASVQGRRVWEN